MSGPLNSVIINVQNGKLGKTPQTQDGVCGLVTTTSLVGLQGSTLKVTSLANAETQGILLSTSPFAHKHIKEFYSEAGDGAVLYVLLLAPTVTMATMVDHANANGAKKLLDFAQGAITLLGITSDLTGEASVGTNFVRADVIAAITGSTTLVNNYRTAYKPIRLLIEGRTDVTTNTPQDLKAMTNNAASVVLGGTANDGHASVGLALGRLAKVPVQRNLGRVKDGALPITEAYIGATLVENFASLQTAVDKGYITIINYTGRSGYFFSDDPTASLPTDDYTQLANGRVIDKVLRLAHQVFINEVNEEVFVNTADGKMDAGFIKSLEGKMEQTVANAMAGEVSGFNCYIDPDQNVLSTNQIAVQAEVVPVAYGKKYVINLGFNNPF